MHLKRIRRNRFLVLGRAGIDLYADPPGTRMEEARKFTSALGGSAANMAAGITRLGGFASLVTAVSDDAVGRFTLNELRRYGVATDHVKTVGGEARNSLAVVETRAENCQSVIYRNDAADFLINTEQMEHIGYGEFGALIVTGTALAVEPSRSAVFMAILMASEAGLPVIIDVDYRPYSWISGADAAATCKRAASLSDVVVGNDAEFAVMANGGDGLALARELASTSAAIAIYKMGEKGAVTFGGGQSFETGIFRVKALKPTGAGDAFMAGLVTGLAGGHALSDCLRRGSASAAIVVSRVGCAPAMPTSVELDDFLARHPDSI